MTTETPPQFLVMDMDPRLPALKRSGVPPIGCIPWGMVEPLRDAVLSLHGQTLERLQQRGGLSPNEILAAAQYAVSIASGEGYIFAGRRARVWYGAKAGFAETGLWLVLGVSMWGQAINDREARLTGDEA